MAYLVRSRRLGWKSSASIEFETSTTSIISIPRLSTSRSFEPSCGRASARVSRANAVRYRMNFRRRRPVEASGMSGRMVSSRPKRLRRRRASCPAAVHTATSNGRSHSSQRYSGYANLNITAGILTRGYATEIPRAAGPEPPLPSGGTPRCRWCIAIFRPCSFRAG